MESKRYPRLLPSDHSSTLSTSLCCTSVYIARADQISFCVSHFFMYFQKAKFYFFPRPWFIDYHIHTSPRRLPLYIILMSRDSGSYKVKSLLARGIYRFPSLSLCLEKVKRTYAAFRFTADIKSL